MYFAREIRAKSFLKVPSIHSKRYLQFLLGNSVCVCGMCVLVDGPACACMSKRVSVALKFTSVVGLGL